MYRYFQQRRFLFTGLMCSASAFFVARPMINHLVSNVTRPSSHNKEAQTYHRSSIALRKIHLRKPVSPPVAEIPIAPPVEILKGAQVEVKEVGLVSNLKPFTLHFFGKMTCSGQPCDGQVNIFFDSDHNPNSRYTVTPAADGTFSVQIPIRELSGGQVDWHLMGRHGLMIPAEARGRTILMDDEITELEQTLSL